MTLQDLAKIINYIAEKNVELNSKYIFEKDLEVDYVCIFSQNDQEHQGLLRLAEEIGEIADKTPTGPVFKFHNRPQTAAGKPKLLKIRTPDPTRPERGDCDFNTNYPEFKKRYLKDPHFKLIKRPNWEMIELMDPEFDVRVYFSSTPLSKDLGIA